MESRRRAQLIENLRHRNRYRLIVELSREAREVLARALEEDPRVPSLTTLVNKIIVEWGSRRNEEVKTEKLRKEVETLSERLNRINHFTNLLEKRLIKISAMAGSILMEHGEKP